MNPHSLHALHRHHLAEWNFCRAAFRGTQALIDHGALPRHPRESPANYAQRRQHAICFNYSRSVIEIFLHYLFEKPGQRDLGPLADDALFRHFMTDVDLFGTDYDPFWQHAQEQASVMGQVGILVSKYAGEAQSRADELAAGIRPYFVLYLPQDILDWGESRDPWHRPCLAFVKLREPDGAIRHWTRQRWELWHPQGNGEYTLTSAGENPLGRVPFVWHRNGRGPERPLGISDIRDVARIDVSLMRNLSQADEVIDLAAFPMLMQPRPAPGDPTENPAVGPRAVLEFDPAYPDARPSWLRAEVLEPVDAILRFIRLKVDEIYRMTNTRGESSIETSSAPSGRALQIMFRQLNARLATKAAALEESEQACLRLWLAWQKQEDLYSHVRLTRPRQFSVENLNEELTSLLTARETIPSVHFRRAVDRAIARRSLPALSSDLMRQVDADIDNAH